MARLSPLERRRQILEEAAKFFAEVGYQKADLEKLAERLSIGKGTIYRYFPSKEELFFATVDRGMVKLTETIEKGVWDHPGTCLEKIQRVITLYLGFFDSHPEYVELFIQERAYFPHREKPTYFIHREANYPRWRALWEELIREGTCRPLDLDATLAVIGDLLYGAIFTARLAKRSTTFEEHAHQILDLILYGVLRREEC